LYAVGGWDNGVQLSSVERYDEDKDQWEMVESMNSKRKGVGVCVSGGRLYAVGGDGVYGLGGALSSVERYDEDKNHWEMIASMTVARTYLGVGATYTQHDFPLPLLVVSSLDKED